MIPRRSFLFAPALLAQKQDEEPPVEFICPMDRDIRTKGPARCPRCGMKLVANLPVHRDFFLDLKTTPGVLQSGRTTMMDFAIRNPETGAIVQEFEVVHEKLFHLFLLHEDLTYFAHEHPERQADGTFRHFTFLPKPGAYRLLVDCFPTGATPQFLTRSIITSGTDLEALGAPVNLRTDLAPKQGGNCDVRIETQPAEPIAGVETLLVFSLSPADGHEPFLGAPAHMLAASSDLIDLIHDHPLYVFDGPRVQFNVMFPRVGTYRVWVQFQRRGIVNTVAFNVPVKALGT